MLELGDGIKRLYLSAAVVFCLLVTALSMNCSESQKNRESVSLEKQFSGFISAIQTDTGNGMLGTLTVESHADKLVHRLRFVVTDKTRIVRQQGGLQRVAQFDSLRPTNRVRVWFTGPLHELGDTPVPAIRVFVESYP